MEKSRKIRTSSLLFYTFEPINWRNVQFRMVQSMGFEPISSNVRDWYPKPLDDDCVITYFLISNKRNHEIFSKRLITKTWVPSAKKILDIRQ